MDPFKKLEQFNLATSYFSSIGTDMISILKDGIITFNSKSDGKVITFLF